MMKDIQSDRAKTYLNPVYKRSFPDPYVIKFCNEYWAYCTGYWHDGNCFGILRSRDLVNWDEAGSALKPPFDAPCYWAPEVFYDNGLFYLYYSVGNETFMEIRMAVSESPTGLFVDSGQKLTNQDFAIDPHVFVDTDGSRYLFYATDFLEHTHIGTGTVVDRMIDEFTLEGNPQPVTRARFDWQIYDPARKEKGGVRWHTVEGAFVLKRKGIYYEMFSGGNWQQPIYGVSYAMSRQVIQNEEWQQASDGKNVLPVLRTLPEKVIGPGHNSAVRAPDNRELFCVYHLWANDLSGRIMAIDRVDFAGKRLFIIGATTTPQRAPNLPTFADFFENESEGLNDGWEILGGHWTTKNKCAVQNSTEEKTEARCKLSSPCFLLEVSLNSLVYTTGSYGVALNNKGEDIFRFIISPTKNLAVISYKANSKWTEELFLLPENFNPQAFHLLRIETDKKFVSLVFGNELIRWKRISEDMPESVSLITHNSIAAFSGFALTVGWENLFEDHNLDLVDLGWQTYDSSWCVENQELICKNNDGFSLITKSHLMDSYEFVVNAKVGNEHGYYGFYPAFLPDDYGLFVTVERDNARWVLKIKNETDSQLFPLPENFDATVYQQFRFLKISGRLHISNELFEICEVETFPASTQIGLYSLNGAAAFDMVRVTRVE